MTLPSPDTCWSALVEHNPAYDGEFVVAVKTTRIYCRPSCKSRLPRRENVTFYRVPAAAEAQGFRACKRCHPKDTITRDEQAQRVQLLCDYLNAHLDENPSLEVMSEVVAWSPFHLQRTFKQVMGISPRRYMEALRVARFKESLKSGETVTVSALEAGFGSSSRVFAHATTHLGMTPTAYKQGGQAEQIAYSMADSSLGRLLVAMTDRGVCCVTMGDNDETLIANLKREFPLADMAQDDDLLRTALEQVLAYLNGWQPHFDLPLDLRVTAFQQRVLDELRRIPYGETRSYGDIARAIGSPKAARAVGNACNRNPIPLIIPCHRVVGSDGSLTGYAFGLERKEQLLAMEQQAELETTE